MAEAIAKTILKEKGITEDEIQVSSGGLWAMTGESASLQAITVMENHGIDLSVHRSKPLTREMVLSADLILTMTPAHRSGVLSLAPETAERVFTLGEFIQGETEANGGILDPYGQTVAVYEQCAAELEDKIKNALEIIINRQDLLS